MPATSRNVHEEGVLFDNWLLVENGRFREQETVDLLTSASFPSRNPTTNVADLRAQIAANEKGVEEVSKMIEHFGLDVVLAYMRHVQDNAEEAVRRVIDALHDGEYSYEMDSGAVIKVRVTVDRADRSATIDFTGTSAQLETNFTRRPRSPRRPSCTCSAPWWPTTYRSTTDACGRCASSSRRAACWRPSIRPPSSPATSRHPRR
jgi:5-oxoprolinase (ATP-hydrolysing)